MSKFRFSKGGDFEQDLIPAEVHVATCIGFVDVGAHDEEFQGKTRERHKCYIVWEIPSLPHRKFSFEDKKTGERKEVDEPRRGFPSMQ